MRAQMRTACPSITSDECRRRAEEAQTLAAQTKDDWERELFQRITTQWVALAVHKKGMEEKRTPLGTAANSRLAVRHRVE